MPRRTVDRVILGAMLALIAAGLLGGWRLYERTEPADATAEVQAWFDARQEGAVQVEGCTREKLDSVFDFHSCVIRTDDAGVRSRYGVGSARPAAIWICFSVPRAAPPAWQLDRDPRPENEPGSSGDCLGRTSGDS